jgi:DNA-binding beta-propeller fold protein YncE
MKKTPAILFTLFVTLALVAPAQDKPPLKLLATTPLPKLVGDLEFFAPDIKGNRLFMCAENSGTVEVFDLHTGKWLRSIPGFAAPHDIVYLPEANNLIVSDGNDDAGWAYLLSGSTYKIIDKIKLPNDVDEAVFDPKQKYFYIESGPAQPDGGKTHLINIIDTKNFKLIGSFSLPGKSSSAMAIDRAAEKMYVNNTGTSEVLVVDLKTRKVIATWPVPGAKGLNGIGLDEANHRFFTASRTPAKFWVFNTDTGKVVTSLPCTSFNDHMIFDEPHKRIYITGTETATVIEQRDADHYTVRAEVPTGYRGKTSILVPEVNRFFVAMSVKDMSGKPLVKPGTQTAVKVYEVLP